MYSPRNRKIACYSST